MARVLFVCTGNTCRSPMAERLARHRYPQHDWESAGVRIWRVGFSPLAARVLEQQGVDTAGFQSRQVETVDAESFDHVVLIGDQAQALCPPLPDTVALHLWDVADPWVPPGEGDMEQHLSAYAATAAELLRRIEELSGVLEAPE